MAAWSQLWLVALELATPAGRLPCTSAIRVGILALPFPSHPGLASPRTPWPPSQGTAFHYAVTPLQEWPAVGPGSPSTGPFALYCTCGFSGGPDTRMLMELAPQMPSSGLWDVTLCLGWSSMRCTWPLPGDRRSCWEEVGPRLRPAGPGAPSSPLNKGDAPCLCGGAHRVARTVPWAQPGPVAFLL